MPAMFTNKTSSYVTNSSISNSFSSVPEEVELDSLDTEELLEDSEGEGGNFTVTPSTTTRSSLNGKSSWVWNHFKRIKKSKTHAFCLLCQKEIFYTKTRSTGMLERHIKRSHPKTFQQALRKGEKKTPAPSQVTMESFVNPCPSFDECLVNYVVRTYQPLRICEEETFRDLCRSMNKKSPIISRDKLHTMVQMKYIQVQEKISSIIKNRYFSLTTDSWTSLANQGYTACTVHFVDKNSWQLHSLVLGIFEKKGPSTAVDNVSYVEQQLSLFDLHYKNMVAVVTDTEATMISAGRLFVENSGRVGGTTKWHGCVDHSLELVTGIAFKDLPESEGTMSACRILINFFNSSSQAMAKLLAKQSVGRAVKPIQDVVTRWWSTWSMCNRLLRLKVYLALMEEEGDLKCNLSHRQWTVVSDLQKTLQPFMLAQRLLEGEAYATISLIPYLIYKVRKNLESLRDSEASSLHVLSIATRMIVKLDEIFGSGSEGTVASDTLPEGP
jgi:hypothetical protein